MRSRVEHPPTNTSVSRSSSPIASARVALGKGKVAHVHTVEVPDVRSIRETLGLSQQAFANAYRVALATLNG